MTIPLILDPGELRSLVQIQAPDYNAEDERGKSAVPARWTKVRETRAKISTAGGRETSQASQIVSVVSHVVKVKWTPTVIKQGYRVILKTQIYTVSYVENVQEANQILLLYCNAVNGGDQ